MPRLITSTTLPVPNLGAAGARLVVVACAQQKLAEPARARDLYVSDLFRKASVYADQLIATGQADAWYVVSAKFGLVDPDAVLDPYDRALTAFKKHERMIWGLDVLDQVQAIAPSAVTLLAGRAYRAPFASYRRAGCTLTAPLAGMNIGQQKAWLKAALAAGRPAAAGAR